MTTTHAGPDPAQIRLGEALRRRREAVLDRLLELEWASDDGDPSALARDPDRTRPRAGLFLDSLTAGLVEGDWSQFDAAIQKRTTDLLQSGVVTADDLNRRALAITRFVIPLVIEEPDPVPVVAALFEVMQSLSGNIVGLHHTRLLEESRRLDDLKTMFLRLTGHELRAPLGTIRGYTSMLADGDFGELSAEVRAAAAAIDSAAGNGLAMLDRLVEVARLESGGEAVRRERHPLEEVVLAAVGPLRDAARERGAELSIDAADEARIDAEEVVIALRNLVANALKYAAAGGVVTLRAHARDGWAVFEVEDRGPGIPAAEQARLFERYYRSERSRSSGVGGSGLGLYIVRRIAELHGGEASVQSVPGEGATFRLRLPAD